MILPKLKNVVKWDTVTENVYEKETVRVRQLGRQHRRKVHKNLRQCGER